MSCPTKPCLPCHDDRECRRQLREAKKAICSVKDILEDQKCFFNEDEGHRPPRNCKHELREANKDIFRSARILNQYIDEYIDDECDCDCDCDCGCECECKCECKRPCDCGCKCKRPCDCGCSCGSGSHCSNYYDNPDRYCYETSNDCNCCSGSNGCWGRSKKCCCR